MSDKLYTNESSFYEILGVTKLATDKEIKKGYRKCALRWHPDKNTDNQKVAEEQFKLVAQAYQTLSDPDKRRDYDRWGNQGGGGGGARSNPFHSGGGGNDIDPNEIFKAFFQSSGMQFGGGNGNIRFQSFSFGGPGMGQFGGGGGGGINQLFQQLHRQQQQQYMRRNNGNRHGNNQVHMPDTFGGGSRPVVHSFDCSFFFKLLIFCYIINFLFFS
jgi:curved DNA-binding protein CbpA